MPTAPAPPALSPVDAFGLNEQLRVLLSGFTDSRALLVQQRAQILAALQNALVGIRAQRRTDLSGQVNASLERGVLGSSADLVQRTNIEADSAAQAAEAQSIASQSLLTNKSQLLQAFRALQEGQINIEAARRITQGSMVTGDFRQGAGGTSFTTTPKKKKKKTSTHPLAPVSGYTSSREGGTRYRGSGTGLVRLGVK